MRILLSEPYEAAGYWRVRWTDPRTGLRRSRSLGRVGKVSRTEARRIARELEDRIGEDTAGPVTLAAWSDRYCAAKTTARPATVEELQRTGTFLADHFGKGRVLDSITPADAEGFRVWLEGRTVGTTNPRPIALNTVRKHIRNAKAMFAQAVAQGYIENNPFRAESGSMVVVDPDWRHIGAKWGPFYDAITPAEVRVLAALCRWAGLRRGEAERLEWGDVDWQACRLTVRTPEGRRTTKARHRQVPIVPALYAVLRERYEAVGAGGHPVGLLAPSTIYARLRAAGKAVGLPEYGKPLHALRAMRESEWLSEFPLLTVTAWLGHSPRVAQQHYARPLDSAFDAAAGRATLTAETVSG
jgi:integrase